MKLVMIMGLFFVTSINPVMMVFFLFFITLIFAFFLFVNFGTFFWGYALMLVMLSGILVVFTYLASMSPNESFEFNFYLFFLGVFMFVSVSYVFFGLDSSFLSMFIWDSVVSFFCIYLLILLLMVMVFVVWVSKVFLGPLRVFNYWSFLYLSGMLFLML